MTENIKLQRFSEFNGTQIEAEDKEHWTLLFGAFCLGWMECEEESKRLKESLAELLNAIGDFQRVEQSNQNEDGICIQFKTKKAARAWKRENNALRKLYMAKVKVENEVKI